MFYQNYEIVISILNQTQYNLHEWLARNRVTNNNLNLKAQKIKTKNYHEQVTKINNKILRTIMRYNVQ